MELPHIEALVAALLPQIEALQRKFAQIFIERIDPGRHFSYG
jgi:hypothetical protein